MKFDSDGLIPAIVQDANTSKVLMMAYMNEESFQRTISTGKVTFWSRSRNQIWIKGETSGNFLNLDSWQLDCDNDTLLLKVSPVGPVCHTGSDTCWGEKNVDSLGFLNKLDAIITSRKNDPKGGSYTSSLFAKGTNKIAQKVGEEATELIIEAKDANDVLFLGEASDLLFHYMILLQDRGFTLTDVIDVLRSRHK